MLDKFVDYFGDTFSVTRRWLPNTSYSLDEIAFDLDEKQDPVYRKKFVDSGVNNPDFYDKRYWQSISRKTTAEEGYITVEMFNKAITESIATLAHIAIGSEQEELLSLYLVAFWLIKDTTATTGNTIIGAKELTVGDVTAKTDLDYARPQGGFKAEFFNQNYYGQKYNMLLAQLTNGGVYIGLVQGETSSYVSKTRWR